MSSSTGAEALAINDTVGEIVYIQAVLREMLGEVVNSEPLEVYTDSKNVLQASTTTSFVEDHRLRIEVATLKESVQIGEVSNVIAVPGKKMLADCLTKRGTSSKLFLDVLKNGKIKF